MYFRLYVLSYFNFICIFVCMCLVILISYVFQKYYSIIIIIVLNLLV